MELFGAKFAGLLRGDEPLRAKPEPPSEAEATAELTLDCSEASVETGVSDVEANGDDSVLL